MKLFFDTETTGLPESGQYDNPKHPNTPHLVELGAILTDDEGVEISTLHRIIRPDGFEIPEAAAAVHGITTERATAEGVPLWQALWEFERLLRQADLLIAHNAGYDLLVVRGAHFRLRFQHLLLGFPVFCTKEASTDICRIPGTYGTFKWPTLTEAHLHLFGEAFDGAHSAIDDARACSRVYFKILSLPQ